MKSPQLSSRIKDILTASSFRHGNRALWLLVALIQPIGPWLYFTFGQKSE
ncbi:PLDc N-terminal domain-containing protein [Pediococcus acidilactici]|nr:PLDc N-terminal domain-containing protein [Pediococcus acidilactici]